jgi:glycosyltransferase involved in cell wall biosynthesis
MMIFGRGLRSESMSEISLEIGGRPFASILVPTFNHERYIRAALDSLLAQTDPSWEAIVVDDGSTDRSGAIIDAYAARDPRIRAVHQPNGGVAAALNTGLRAARGQWVHWLSSDDLFQKDKLAVNRRWIERNPGVNFFYSYFWLLHEASACREKRDLWGPIPEPGLQIPTLFYRNYISGITICINREAWNRAGLFDERYHYAQDYALWLRLLVQNEARFIPEWTVVNRHHAGQGSEQFPEACYFDTARAGIDFLNSHPLTWLVPRIDLSDPVAAAAAIKRIVNIACERSAFLYSLGPHPALILRVLEWVFGDEAQPSAMGLREQLRQRVRHMALAEGDDDWSWMWRGLAVACAQPDPRFAYHPVDVRALARHEHAVRRQGRGGPAEPLRVYLRRFEGLDEAAESPPGSGANRVVMLAPAFEPAQQAARAAAAELAGRGLRTALVVAGHPYRWEPALATLPRPPIDRDGLPWLGEAELALALDRRPVPVWLEAAASAALDGAAVLKPDLIVAEVVTALGLDGNVAHRRPVAFLQRVLAGGGAERVVHDLVRRLDRRRFGPVILTLFDCRDQAGLVGDVDTCWVRAPIGGAASALAPPPTAAAAQGSEPARVRYSRWTTQGVLIGIRLYERLVPRALDRRIGLGHRLVYVRQGLLSGVPVRHYVKMASRRLPRMARARRTRPLTAPEANAAPAPQIAADAALLTCLDAHRPAAEGLRNRLAELGGDAALVTVMEEAAAAAWFAQIGGSIPFIASLHTCESAYLPMMYPNPARLAVERWVFANACSSACQIVFPSRGCCDDLRAGFGIGNGKTTTIANPINCARVRRLSWAPLPAEDAAAIPDTPCFVHVGRLDPSKNHDLLLEACLRLKASRTDFRVLCIGDGPERQRLAAAIASNGLERHIILLGARHNPYPLVRRATALILTSNFEAFALVLAEAMACGVPVISTNCPAGPAEVLEDGKSGLLVPVNDAEALAAAMLRVATDEPLRQRLIAAGYERVKDFDVSVIARQWEAMIDTTLRLPQQGEAKPGEASLS